MCTRSNFNRVWSTVYSVWLLSVSAVVLSWFFPLPATSQNAIDIYDLRASDGLLMDFRPNGVVWLDGSRLFMVDRRYNAFAVFNTRGERIRYIEPPQDIPLADYTSVAPLDKYTLFVCGSHYHRKNNPRFLFARSVIHKLDLVGEGVSGDSADTNYSPDLALRATHYYGSTPRAQMEIQGLAIDKKHNRLWIGLARPLAVDGTVLIYEAPLDKFLARDKKLRFKKVKTGLKPEIEPACGTPFHLSDLVYVEGRGLVLLLTADADRGRRFCSNQIWFMPGGFGPAKLIRKELVPGNRCTGIALYPIDKWNYRVALVADNNPEETHIPSRLIMLDRLRLSLKGTKRSPRRWPGE